MFYAQNVTTSSQFVEEVLLSSGSSSPLTVQEIGYKHKAKNNGLTVEEEGSLDRCASPQRPIASDNRSKDLKTTERFLTSQVQSPKTAAEDEDDFSDDNENDEGLMPPGE